MFGPRSGPLAGVIAALLLAFAPPLLTRALANTAVSPLSGASPSPTVHTIFSTQCSSYFDWQSIVLAHSFRASGQPGKLTRLLSCKPEDLARVRQTRSVVFDIVDTFVTDDATDNTAIGDSYPPYNRPYALRRWLDEAKPDADVVLIFDPDMVIRAPLDPVKLGVTPGRPVGAFYGYMKGSANELADAIVPELPRMQDRVGGVDGRRGDQVGAFFMIYREDLATIVDDYMRYSEKVRLDPDAWRTTGDRYTTTRGGGRSWISEMYGWSFAAAKHGLRHRAAVTEQAIPGVSSVNVAPHVLHYYYTWEAGPAGSGIWWNKEWFKRFDPIVCPPWPDQPWTQPFGMDSAPVSGLFPTPPHPSTLRSLGRQRLTELMTLEPLITADTALCEWHRLHCPPSAQLDALCLAADDRERAFRRELEALGDLGKVPQGAIPCEDYQEQCEGWAASDQCLTNAAYMFLQCPKSCRVCGVGAGSHLPVGAGGGGEPRDVGGVLPLRTYLRRGGGDRASLGVSSGARELPVSLDGYRQVLAWGAGACLVAFVAYRAKARVAVRHNRSGREDEGPAGQGQRSVTTALPSIWARKAQPDSACE